MVASKSHNYASPDDYLEGEKISPSNTNTDKAKFMQGQDQAMPTRQFSST
jgi:hypothetical protein